MLSKNFFKFKTPYYLKQQTKTKQTIDNYYNIIIQVYRTRINLENKNMIRR